MEVFEFYDTIKTQWNVGMAGLIGLNYASIEMASRVYEFELTPFRMDVIREIESFYLKKGS